MTEGMSLSTWTAIGLVSRGVWLELLRRKDLYVLLLFMGIFVIYAVATRVVGIDNDATATFLLNLGLTMAYILAHVFTLVLALRQIPNEMEKRTVYPMLAKPLAREQFVVGKWLACVLCGTFVYAVLFLLGWVSVPKRESFETGLLVQTILLAPISLAMLAAASICASLFLPRAIGLVLLGGLFFLGDTLIGFLQQKLVPGVGRAGSWCLEYVPNFDKLNLIVRYTDGIVALSWYEWGMAVMYGSLWVVLFLAVGVMGFRRRPL